MLLLDEKTAVVYTTDDLKEAVSYENTIDYVYFGANITLANGVRIHNSKTSLVIDGLHEGNAYTFTDMDSNSQSNTLYVQGVSKLKITLKNLTLIGRNYFGIPSVYESADTAEVEITYDKVKYTGRQMVFHRYGLARFIDCNITIAPTSRASNEVGEVGMVEIGGTTIINHNDSNDSVFWFPTGSEKKYIKVLADANVTVTTQNDFLYTDTTPVSLTLEPRAIFKMETYDGFARGSSHRLSSFLVDEKASFKYSQTTNNGTNASMFINGALTVKDKSRFFMQVKYSESAPLIQFTTTASSLNVENPKSFVLYKPATPALSFANSIPFSFNGGQLNYWPEANMPSPDGTLDDIPSAKWHKPKWNTFSVSGTASSNGTTVQSHSFTEEEMTELPSFTNLKLEEARVLSIGDLPLVVNPITPRRNISGTTDPYANVEIDYTATITPLSRRTTAKEDGEYAMEVAEPVPVATVVTVRTNVPFLITTLATTAQEEGELGIEEAPTLIRFVRPPLSTNPLLLARETTLIHVVVIDERVDPGQWELLASIEGPMATQSGHQLPDGVVYIDSDNVMLPLRTDTQLRVFVGGPEIPRTEIDWLDSDKGILLNVTEPLLINEEYTARMIWEVKAIE